MLLAANFKLGVNGIDIVNSLVLGLLGNADLVHAPTESLSVQMIEVNGTCLKYLSLRSTFQFGNKE